MDLVLGVYSKALLQDSCSHQWPLGKFPHSQLCCRHLRPNPYDDSHCVAAPVRYDTRLSSSSICSEDKKGLIKQALAACSCRLQLLVSYPWSSAAVSMCVVFGRRLHFMNRLEARGLWNSERSLCHCFSEMVDLTLKRRSGLGQL